jgi:hypothetical protein
VPTVTEPQAGPDASQAQVTRPVEPVVLEASIVAPQPGPPTTEVAIRPDANVVEYRIVAPESTLVDATVAHAPLPALRPPESNRVDPGRPVPPAGMRALLRRNRMPLILGAIVAAVIITIVIVVVSLQGGGAKTPEEAAKNYFTAAEQGDVKGMQANVCDADQGRLSGPDPVAGTAGFDNLRGAVDFAVIDVKENGSGTRATASVKFTLKVPGGPSATNLFDVPLVMEKGSWKVCYD